MAVCWPSATAEWGWRRLLKIHEKPDRAKTLDRLHPLDGVSVYAAGVDPGPGDPFMFPAERLAQQMRAERETHIPE